MQTLVTLTPKGVSLELWSGSVTGTLFAIRCDGRLRLDKHIFDLMPWDHVSPLLELYKTGNTATSHPMKLLKLSGSLEFSRCRI